MNIEIWSDVACPWCYVGKRRFEKALASFEGRENVQVIWRSYELDPRAPREQLSGPEVLARKYRVSGEQANAMNDRLRTEALKEGLTMAPERIRMVNTFEAHRLIHHAATAGKRAEMVERLFAAYHTEGALLSDHDVLVALAKDVGLEERAVRTVLEGDAFSDAVRAEENRAAEFGINGVPFFAIDERYGISGAQPSEVMLSALRQAAAARVT